MKRSLHAAVLLQLSSRLLSVAQCAYHALAVDQSKYVQLISITQH